MLSIVLAIAFAQSPTWVHPPARQHENLPHEIGRLVRAGESLDARVATLEARVAILEAGRCQCHHDGLLPRPAKPPEPPTVVQPAVPSWRLIGSVYYYGVQDGPVFRYTHVSVPFAAGCRSGGCGR